MTEKEKQMWVSLYHKMNDEGFHYCFTGYSDWEEIKDDEFQALRKMYISATSKLEKYIEGKANEAGEETINT